MAVQKIIKQIKTGSLPRLFLIHGEEIVWQDQIYEALKDLNCQDSLADFNWSVFYGAKDFDLAPLFVELSTLPWGAGPKIIILKKGELILAEIMERLALWLDENANANCLAIFATKIDQCFRATKILRKFAVEVACTPLQGERLLRYVVDRCAERGREMKRSTAELFLNRVGSNLLVIQNELEKLFELSEGESEITSADVGAISSLWPDQVEKNTVFQMTDFIAQKKRQEALDVLDLLLMSGEPALRILPLIERQLRLILAAKTATNTLDITAKEMGENSSYALKKIHKAAQGYECDEIFNGFKAVLDADRQLKLGSSGEEVLADLIIKLT